MKRIFEFEDYRKYINLALEEQEKERPRGGRSRFAQAIQCAPGYVTQILRGDSNISLDQAELAAEFFGLTDDETDYFLLLVIHARSGNPRLTRRIEARLERSRENHFNLKKRLRGEETLREVHATYYSAWEYMAIYEILSSPKMQSLEMIAAYFGLPLKRVSDVLMFFERSGMVVHRGGKYVRKVERTHIGIDSPWVTKHLINWRMQAMHSIERRRRSDMHYSAVISLKSSDIPVIKAHLAGALEEASQLVDKSESEHVTCLNVDFFGLGKNH